MLTIGKQLARLNELGFLTINSQPAVDGARSNDKIFGWGPRNGYVYQKAYLEFFVQPELLAFLLPLLDQDPEVIYYAISDTGTELKTNNANEAPNAVTWGVFPGKEIVQPTIVEAVSFMAWKVSQTLSTHQRHTNDVVMIRTKRSNLESNGHNSMNPILHLASSSTM